MCLKSCSFLFIYAVELEDYDRDFNYVDYNEPATQCDLPDSWIKYKNAKNKREKEVKNEAS